MHTGEQHVTHETVPAETDPPCSPVTPAEPVPNGMASRANISRKAGIALIDEFPLRRASTLNLLRSHFREGMRQFSSSAEFLAHASTYADAPSALVKCIGRHSVADTPLSGRLHLIRRAFPVLPVIVLSDREEAAEVVAAFRRGIQGYIPTSFPPHLVISAIRIVMAGGTFYPATALTSARKLVSSEVAYTPCTPQVTPEHRRAWPPRQLEVLRLLAEGKANKQIAQKLMIEEGTVKVHLRQIMRKLGVTNRTQAALAARRLGVSVALKDTVTVISSSPDAASVFTRPAWLNDRSAASRLNRLADTDPVAYPTEAD